MYLGINSNLKKLTFLSFALLLSQIGKAENVKPECCNYAATKGAIKVQFFLEACSVPGKTKFGMVPYFDCQSFVLGVVSTYRQLNSQLPKSNQLCIPESLTTKNLLELILKQYPNWSIKEERLASEVILETLKSNYSCGNI